MANSNHPGNLGNHHLGNRVNPTASQTMGNHHLGNRVSPTARVTASNSSMANHHPVNLAMGKNLTVSPVTVNQDMDNPVTDNQDMASRSTGNRYIDNQCMPSRSQSLSTRSRLNRKTGWSPFYSAFSLAG